MSEAMNTTVFLTVISGVLTYVLGQLVLKLVIEPLQETKKLIGQIAHSLTEHANVVQNPGVPSEEAMRATSQHLRKLSAQPEAQLYLVPMYAVTAFVFRLPSRSKILSAARSLTGLSNSVFRGTDGIYKSNSRMRKGLRTFMIPLVFIWQKATDGRKKTIDAEHRVRARTRAEAARRSTRTLKPMTKTRFTTGELP